MDNKDVKKIARLARLSFTDQELETMQDSLNSVFGLVDQIEQIDTQDTQPLANPLEMVQRERADEVSEGDQRAGLHQIAPQVGDDLYLVPKVIDS